MLKKIFDWPESGIRILLSLFTNGTNCCLGQIVAWDKLSLGTNCRSGQIVAWDKLSLGLSCRLRQIVAWDELSLETNCRLGRIVAQPKELSKIGRRIGSVGKDVLSSGPAALSSSLWLAEYKVACLYRRINKYIFNSMR